MTKAAGKRAPAGKRQTLELTREPGKTDERIFTDMVSRGVVSNASTTARFAAAVLGEMSLTDMVASLQASGEAVNRGDLAAAERMLNSQAVALDVIFAEMARRAALNMGEHLPATEIYMRLALKGRRASRGRPSKRLLP